MRNRWWLGVSMGLLTGLTGLTALTALTGLAGLAGCEAESADAGTAPTIAKLSLTKETVAVGKQETIEAQFQFEDPDGDVATAHVTLSAGAQTLDLPAQSLQNVGGVAQGIVKVIVAVVAPAAGPMELRFQVKDQRDNPSNTLTATVTAQ